MSTGGLSKARLGRMHDVMAGYVERGDVPGLVGLGTLPLMHQPGEKWTYHTESEVLGVLIARAAGQPLETFFRERLFEPLGMKDTGFHVPAAKLGRLASCYWTNPDTGTLELFTDARDSRWSRPPAFPAGGGGLVSTVDDYLAFGQMLLNQGKHGCERILSRPSVELMTTDQLTPEQKAVSAFVPGFWDSRGWGFGVSMVTRLRDQLSAERRQLPWVRVQKRYVFDGPDGKETLSDLFDGRSQLIVYHFMFGPGWQEGCPSCSFLADHIDGAVVYLAHRDVTLLAVSRAPLPQIAAFKKRMGWRFKWVSSYGSDFNYDYHVSFTKEEMAKGNVYYNYELQDFGSEEAPGASVFYKDGTGDIFHTYSCYARGGDILIGAYHYLDLVPKGRDEDALAFTMAWVRHHDRYSDDYSVDRMVPYQPPKGSEGRVRS